MIEESNTVQFRKGFFFELTPERVLEAVEMSGLKCTGRCLTLNSFENRVYDVELENEAEPGDFHLPTHRRIVKFYRPNRWNRKQILEEHEFLFDLARNEVPAIAPLTFPNFQTLQTDSKSQIYYALFPKVGGRAPDELTDEQLRWIGRLLARVHTVGASKKTEHRLRLDPQTYGYQNLEFLLKNNWIPLEFQSRYRSAVEKICEMTESWFKYHDFHRIHGDCHYGNLLWNTSGPFFLDFDDMVCGPAVQDIWLLVPARDPEGLRQREVFLEGYREWREFDLGSLRLIEPLRALRFVHYTAWIARRWEDPAFPQIFPQFGSHQYWSSATEDLEDQINWVRS